ncbi:hypothetical protein Sme01_04240 [Sphaerisporangium melleum]|uniref:HTH cro/C1-type domain-containing protein n=1 Tax=Sphaerisporangium melleum TaxID=321316 RepID=A0A917VCD4_9ACTN|nr:helix-turn-helix transcriptional regulator [Sphaerisporangium melleum]GGK62274.1 hypothetical protein GCM10007964_01790 [Sphaerisporangium melleum]GII67948.1 hypothetical protein Sme01_04240 [Sphaerisporangium melleum]
MRSIPIDGRKLQITREERELSGPALAELLSADLGRKVHASTIYRLEGGDRQPSPKLFGALLRILQCDKSQLAKASTTSKRSRS